MTSSKGFKGGVKLDGLYEYKKVSIFPLSFIEKSTDH